MPSIRLPFDELSPDELSARVQSEFGASARIVSASEVRVGGVGGFFARRYLDIVVDVAPASGSQPKRPNAVGLAALLDQADRVERAEMPPVGVPVIPAVSTQTDDFARLMSELRSYAEVPNAGMIVSAGAPALHDTPGGIVLFIGLGDDAMLVARSLAHGVGSSELRMGGRILGDALPRVDDRRQAAAFRAQCIRSGSMGLLAWSIGLGASDVQAGLPTLRAIDADQIWIVVDASRKSEDTVAWVSLVRGGVPAQAIAVLHGVETRTPDTVSRLGLPVGWSDTLG